MAARLMAMIGAITAMLLVLSAIGGPATARADGDPASDVLAAREVFLPADAGASTSQQELLTTVVREATGRGLPIRVAVISSRSDLGSVYALWGHPQPYARFLGTELSLIFSGQLLVVMPNGFGLYHAGSQTATELAALAHASVRGSNLTVVAANAVRALAQVTGHALPQLPSGGTATASGTRSGSSVLPWVVLGAGAVVVLLAWTASFRAAPLRRAARRTPAETQS